MGSRQYGDDSRDEPRSAYNTGAGRIDRGPAAGGSPATVAQARTRGTRHATTGPTRQQLAAQPGVLVAGGDNDPRRPGPNRRHPESLGRVCCDMRLLSRTASGSHRLCHGRREPMPPPPSMRSTPCERAAVPLKVRRNRAGHK
ncbi:hypothetical protein GCM10010231_37390 [Streptomyces sindenensis]|nr:hypothetical protein GCM10010231_37390 [Streptomyces sindenensis]